MSCKKNDLAIGPRAGKSPENLDEKGLSIATVIMIIVSRSHVEEVQHRQGAGYVPMSNLSQPCHFSAFLRIAPIYLRAFSSSMGQLYGLEDRQKWGVQCLHQLLPLVLSTAPTPAASLVLTDNTLCIDVFPLAQPIFCNSSMT